MPPRVRLREVEEQDLPIFFEHQREPAANRMAAFEPRELDAFTAHWTRILADPSSVERTVVADGEVVGNIVSWEQDGRREVGYWIGQEHWGKGLATAALRLLLEIVDDRPLLAHVAAHNVGSIRVLERCGFSLLHETTASDGVREYLYELPA
jgi:RimJ/RimL family protein N-acetyltransferase